MLLPKDPKLNLDNLVDFLNKDDTQNQFMSAGRFKISHKQLSYLYIQCTDIIY